MTRAFALAAALLALSPRPGLAIGPEADKLVLQGLEAGYALDFASSSAAFAAVDRLEPQHPIGPFFLASLKWMELSLNVDEPGKTEALEPEFDRLMGEAFARAQRMKEKNPRDAEAYFYLGAAYGMRGRWKIVKRQWIRAASDGWKGYKNLKTAVALDPALYDAYLGLGMYDYYSDTMPGILKFAASLIVRGDKQRGLRFVNIAVEKGHYSAMEAQLFLVGVYTTYEKKPEHAILILHDLRLERADNLFLLYLEVQARKQARDWVGAVDAAEVLALRSRKTPYARPFQTMFDLALVEVYLGAKDYAKARDAATSCIAEAPDPRKGGVTFCLVRRAEAFDLLSQRRAAMADYSAADGRPDFWDTKGKARRGLQRPATYESLLKEMIE